jgi:hypothetical protein
MRAATASNFKGKDTAMELKSTRRIVTGHDSQGKAVVLFDGAMIAKQRGANGITLFWVTSEFPVDAAGAIDRAQTAIGVPPPENGTVFRIVDFAPGGAARSASRSPPNSACDGHRSRDARLCPPRQYPPDQDDRLCDRP